MIKNKSDAREILLEMKAGTIVIIDNDDYISMPNGGDTVIKKYHCDYFVTYSYGENWVDQQKLNLTLEEAVNFFYKRRKGYNRRFR